MVLGSPLLRLSSARALRVLTALAIVVAALALSGRALAAGGTYTFASGTLAQQTQVRAALDATAKIILADHIESCLHGAVEGGDAEVAWADLRTALETFIR